MKRVRLLILLIASVLVLSGCIFKGWLGMRPCDQKNTCWISEDESIMFWVNDSGAGIGEMVIDDTIISIYVAIGPTTAIHIYLYEDLHGNVMEGYYIEYWSGTFKKMEQFTATVKTTTYFKEGQKITFYRVEDKEL